MEFSKEFRRVAGVVGAAVSALMTGCASMGSVGQQRYALADSPEMRGAVQYGSSACRDAGITPVELNSYNADKYRSRYVYSFRMAAERDNDITERAPDGRMFILVSDELEAMSAETYKGLRALAPATGAAIGARGAIENARKDRHTDFGSTAKNAALGSFAVAIGNGVGEVASEGVDKILVQPIKKFLNGGATRAELTDICRAAVRNGDYGGKGRGYEYNHQAQPSQYRGQPGTQYDWYQRRSDELNLRVR